jgi:hypothetical protein
MIEGGGDCAPNELLPKLEAKLPLKRLSIFAYSERVPARFQECYQKAWESLAKNWKLREGAKAEIIFHVAGFDENKNDGRVYKVVLTGRANRSLNRLEPEFKVLDRREIMKENTYCIACGGKREIFQKVYNEYFSNNKELMQNPPPADGTCEYPIPEMSLEGAEIFVCSLMRRAINLSAEIGNAEIAGEIHACTIPQDSGLKMLDCSA